MTAAVVVAVSPVVASWPAPAGAESYRLKKGDTLSAVAKRFNTTVSQLVAVNGIADRHRVRAGRVLQIPTKGSPAKTPKAASTAASGDGVSRGYDVSYPQCGEALPTSVAFAIVGVNGGRPFTVNPCLKTEMAWAGKVADEPRRFYVNTSNPGPQATAHWPSGQSAPKQCAGSYPANDSLNCAYDFGYGGAKFAASQVPGGADAGRWWLDVETMNTWSANQASNFAVIQGTIDYFRGQGAQVGIYSTGYQWGRITGGAAVPGVPVWIAGEGDYAAAVRACNTTSFSGGRVTFTQYAAGGFDANHRC
ncbi:MAG TPA: LysM peptidoglycan-binding domain-containing protein [Acidimicrobiales bacterium]|jgi:LysM repeat protein